MNALILAAGLGTRLGPYTSDRPKALVEVNGRPMLWWQLHKLAAQGFDRFIVNVHHFAPMVIDYLHANRNFGLDIRISNESGLLLDTGGGIRQAMHMLDNQDPLLVHNVDIFSNANAAALYRAHSGSNDHTGSDCHAVSGCHATLLTASRDTSRYLYFDNSNILQGWSNIKTGQQRSPYTGFTPKDFTPRAFQGIHVLSQEILPYLDKVTEPAFSITDFYIDNCRTLKIQGLETVPAWKPSSELEPQSDKDIQSGKELLSDKELESDKELQSLQWADAGRPETLSQAAKITALYKIS